VHWACSGEGKLPLKIAESVANILAIFLQQTQVPGLPTHARDKQTDGRKSEFK